MAERRTFRIGLAYDGAAFWGFARQVGRPSVEQALRDALEPLLDAAPAIAVAGRTDRGVSATGQVVSFHTRSPVTIDALRDAIDRASPQALACLGVEEVPRRFHARFSAVARRYVYLVDAPDVRPDVIDRLLLPLLGRRDFHVFARDTPPGRSTVRHLFDARARPQGDRLRIDLCADAFLRRQVRVLAATALREARRGAPDDALLELAERGDRSASAPPLDPDGLTLARVIY